VQASYPEGDVGAGLVPTVAAFSFSLNLMPAYLDFKARTVPERITEEYYGLNDPQTSESSDEDNNVYLRDDNV
jgi:hypothetical protein